MSKPKQLLILLCLLISTSVIFSSARAHTPLNPGDEIHSLDTAFEIPNPTKSWTLYRELHNEGEAEYFKLHLNTGERLRANLYIKEIAENFSPNLIIIGEDLPDTDLLPVFIEIPEGFGASLIESSIPEKPEYEPFTPASYYYLVDVDEPISKEGDYYVVVYEPNLEEGKYGIAIGYKEEFTVSEWLLIPFDVIGIHQWEGQSLILILAPLLLSLVFGFVLLAWKSLIKLDLFNVLGISAGLLYVGSGLMLIMQMILALIGSTYDSLIVLTLIFGALPMLLGFVLVRKIVLFKGQLSTVDRIVLVVLGLAGFFTWSGLLIGPALVIIVSLLPNQVFQKRDK
ncbi:hypothetical protein MUO66_03875 [Candidatus Bathyarchaeota archaeon]|nr:hypothetical protein [Candidatus Bathyarchaeota archaeon]